MYKIDGKLRVEIIFSEILVRYLYYFTKECIRNYLFYYSTKKYYFIYLQKNIIKIKIKYKN
jgi:hypothetical protein